MLIFLKIHLGTRLSSWNVNSDGTGANQRCTIEEGKMNSVKEIEEEYTEDMSFKLVLD
jgi:hypothetical protein